MQKFNNTVRLGLIYAAVVLLAGGYPMTAMAAETIDSTPPAVINEQTPETPGTAPAPVAQPVPERYTYNPDTGHWDSNKWAYNPATNDYEPVVAPPAATEQVVPVADAAPLAESHNTPHGQAGADSTLTVNTDATIDNNINSDATTGNAGVRTNTVGGNATTGDASAMATVINQINSSVNGNGAEFATFVTDVVGDVHGDIMLYPMLLA
ncbi:MAG: hypothetical protein ABWX90_02385, partial [Candidatus Saccharimonadales bacterium]